MNPHFSAEEIARWAAGERGDRAVHLAECAECAAEVRRLEAAVAEFGGALRSAAVPPAAVDVGAARRAAPRVARWVLAAAALAMLAAAPVWRHRQAEMRAEAARADATLLDEVDAEVSEAVPSPMEPLVPLVSWKTSNEGNGEMQ
jgi:hypothetical protein